MIHKRLVIGMMSSAIMLAACEPVDEAADTEEAASETDLTETEADETADLKGDSAVESTEEQGAEGEPETEDAVKEEADEGVTYEAEPDENESESGSGDTVAEDDAAYDVAEETEEKVDEEDELVYDIDALDLPSPEDLPLDDVYIEVNDNVPLFTNEELEISEPFHSYDSRDELGRVGMAEALLDVELMPAEQRGSISHIEPTGWNQGNYEVVSGNWLYNRSHLIGHQMTGYDGKNNLMTGTRQFNVEGMLPFENFVASVVEDTEMQVRYRVTALFEDDNLLAHGILMEGFSLDDNGETLTFNVFVPNQQDGIELDYETGEHALVE
ncbi:MAG: DNA/RNA non-specific endonuclease [Alkalibacterium sp.]|nr:DNA/RNA non-specific endonuclease [Alkalibacterium sp.]